MIYLEPDSRELPRPEIFRLHLPQDASYSKSSSLAEYNSYEKYLIRKRAILITSPGVFKQLILNLPANTRLTPKCNLYNLHHSAKAI